MLRDSRAIIIAACLMLIAQNAAAQSSIAGVVEDTTGAVLPGVTVEASSPALIDKVRTVVTDEAGRDPNRRPPARNLYSDVHAHWLQRYQT